MMGSSCALAERIATLWLGQRRRQTRSATRYLICVCWRLEECRILSANVSHSAAISRRIVRASWFFCHARHSQTVPCVTSVFFVLVAFGNCHVSIPHVPNPSAFRHSMQLVTSASLFRIDHFSKGTIGQIQKGPEGWKGASSLQHYLGHASTTNTVHNTAMSPEPFKDLGARREPAAL